MYLLKRLTQCCLAIFFVLVMANMAQAAGPLQFTMGECVAGDLNDDGTKQKVTFTYTVKNISKDTYVDKLNNITVSVNGHWGKSKQETYKRKVETNYKFGDAGLAPGKSKKLRSSFWRKINTDQGWHPYRVVFVEVKSYNWKGGKG